jgi:hypothetical protein
MAAVPCHVPVRQRFLAKQRTQERETVRSCYGRSANTYFVRMLAVESSKNQLDVLEGSDRISQPMARHLLLMSTIDLDV